MSSSSQTEIMLALLIVTLFVSCAQSEETNVTGTVKNCLKLSDFKSNVDLEKVNGRFGILLSNVTDDEFCKGFSIVLSDVMPEDIARIKEKYTKDSSSDLYRIDPSVVPNEDLVLAEAPHVKTGLKWEEAIRKINYQYSEELGVEQRDESLVWKSGEEYLSYFPRLHVLRPIICREYEGTKILLVPGDYPQMIQVAKEEQTRCLVADFSKIRTSDDDFLKLGAFNRDKEMKFC